MRKILSTAVISVLMFMSCKDGDSSSEKNIIDSTIVTNKNTTAQPSDTSAAVQQVQNTIQTLPATMPTNSLSPVTTINTPSATAATNPAVTAPGMNPAHGQPGHRCDISVGAPLNSAPTKTTTNAATTTTPAAQPVITSTPTPTPTKTAPGMNPPHGQPGHRCDVTVGAPLNSAPAKAAATKAGSDIKTATNAPVSISLDSTKK